jgi:hypothetical protein
LARFFLLLEEDLKLILLNGQGFRLTLELGSLIVTDFLEKPRDLLQLFGIAQN